MQKLLFFSILICLVLTVHARPVSEAEARRLAQSFLQQRGKTPASASRMKTAARGRRAAGSVGHNSYYVFNIGLGQGFVVVGGDSRAAAILGYADSGSIAPDDMPDGLRFLLDTYAEEVTRLGDTADSEGSDETADNTAASRRVARAPRHAISPLVVTRWDQGTPYNTLCPIIDGTQCVTGCVATSMAQVMYHHRWPEGKTANIPAYTTSTKKITIAKLPATTFSWNAMTPTYGTALSGSDAETAVATLMQYCGASLQMNYNVGSAGGSSAYNVSIAEALKTYFGYDASYIQRQHYSYAEWVDMVYGELASHRPVVLGGQSANGGHSFVCDGYDADDYFHINWGWSGSSDGYFRLSALNPYEQGTGGSGTLDGYSFMQDAIVGIQPRPAGNAPACLSLEMLQLDATGAAATTIVSRESADAAFTGIPLYVSLCSYFGTALFDYAVQLSSADGSFIATLYSAGNVEMVFNKNMNLTLQLSFTEPIADGTYYIEVHSRLSGQTEWQECYDGQKQRIVATVSGNTLTLQAPIVSGAATVPSAVDFTVVGNQTQGYEQTVIASVTGGSVDYYGDLVLRVDGTAVMGKSVEIPAGKTVDVRFSYTPSKAGDNVLALYTTKSSGTPIGAKEKVAIAASDATNDLDLTFSAVINNQANEGPLYGNAFRATVTVSNPSTEHDYVGQLNCSARQWTKTETTVDDVTTTAWKWESLGVTSYPLTVAKGGTAEVEVSADDLPAEGCYSFRITYQRVAGGATVADAIHLGLVNDGTEHGSLKMTDGYRLGNAAGGVTVHAPSNTIDAGDACFVDLRGLASLSGVTVTPSTNPNCLYLLADDAAVPGGLPSSNVVRGTNTENLTLTDGHDFYTPLNFTAGHASYTRTFTQPAAGKAGWTTIVLPFAATTVTVPGGTSGEAGLSGGSAVEKTWFRSNDDEDGSFWLRSFTADGEGTVSFDHTQQMEADTPYIIAVPGDTWGEEWQMTDRPVTFSTTDASVKATTATSVTGSRYKFCATTAATAVADAFVLNDNGSSFVRAGSKDIPAFRAWFLPVSISSLTLPALTISSNATAIRSVGCDATACPATANGWFTLGGQRLATAPTVPGLYIYNGKKTIIK